MPIDPRLEKPHKAYLQDGMGWDGMGQDGIGWVG
jgi:hypothetical protein